MLDADRRMLFVHAHPDDESITTGATMARYAAEGVHVALLTCTLGEEGEILVPGLAALEAAQADQLGGYRIGELAAALRALGVADHRFLGGAGRFRDSGMLGAPANAHPRAFWRASTHRPEFDEAVAAVVRLIREVRPQVVVTYDPNGDYGHPDHVMAHRVTTAAVERAADPEHRPLDGAAWQVAKLYWTATPRSQVEREFAAVAAADVPFDVVPLADLPFGVADDEITASVDVTSGVEAKLAALTAHATQVVVRAPFYALSNLIGRQVLPVEHYRLAAGTAGPDLDADGRETDLFSGVAAAP